uniref:Mercuric reductase n=1 Tax=Chaetoceros debilis TaxID=122233 RepID=A0A7S3V5X3_9STRA
MHAKDFTDINMFSAKTFGILLVASYALGGSYAFSLNASSGSASSSKNYDLVVIGGGSAGLTAAKFAATFGKSAVIVEKARMGGDCTWTGCIPSKSLIASAKMAHNVRRAAEFGINTDVDPATVTVDMKAIKRRIESNIDRIYQEDDSPEAMKKLGIDVLSGTATLTDSKTLKVTNEETSECFEVCANDGILIATGASPKAPSIPGLDDINYITYEQAFGMEEVPSTMTIVGGGPIGCELAQAYSRLGSKVTVIASSLLPNEEPEVGKVMQSVFESEGIVVTNSRLDKVESQPSSSQAAHVATCQDSQSIQGDVLLVATGRKPVVTGMGLEDLNVELNDKGGVKVDVKLQTSVKGLYAAGDCTGDRQFTHYAGYQGAVGARNILLPLSDPGVMDAIIGTTFTDPEISSIGLTEKEAMEEFGERKVAVAFQNINETDRAICEGIKKGCIKIVYKKKGYKILGAAVVSPVAGEIISEIAVAMKSGLSFDMLATVMHTYPSHSFALQSMAAEVYYEKLVKSKGILNFMKRVGL